MHGCQGDRVSFDFASVHQLLRDCADEAHVDSEAEGEVLILCIVSVERRRSAHASQVLEQLGITKFRHSRSSVASSQTGGFNEQAPLPCTILREQ